MAQATPLEANLQRLRKLNAAELQAYDEQGFVILDTCFRRKS